MPTLDWIGKKAVINHDKQVPFHLLTEVPELSYGDKDSGNMLIQGDNLIALKSLLPYYAGKVKCIYIDPPYNTGNEGWIYNDNVSSPEIKEWLGNVVGKEAEDLSRHDKWLCMMYPRLKLLRELLRRDGVIFISIDDNEKHFLKLLCDEIFGAKNFIADIAVINNFKGRSDDKFIATAHEGLLIYHNGEFETNGVKLPEEYENDYKLSDAQGRYRLQGLRKRGSGARREDRPNMFYPFYYNPKTEILSVDCTDEGFVKILPHLSDGSDGRWRWGIDTARARISELIVQKVTGRNEFDVFQKDYLENNGLKRIKPKSFWMGAEFSAETGTLELKAILGKGSFDTPKPVGIVEYCIEQSMKDSDILLDSFAGSGTSAHALMLQNSKDNGKRKFILIEMNDTIAQNVTAKRVKSAVMGYKTPQGKPTVGLGGGFRYYRLGSPLFDEFGNVFSEIKFADLAKHIFFSETGTPLPDANDLTTPFIGEYNERGIFLLYNGILKDKNPKNGNVLTREVLAMLPKFDGEKVIYGTGCRLSDARLKAERITFKQIPYDLRG